MTAVRLAHSRFHNGKPVSKAEQFDKVVSTVWSFEPEHSILTYASTIYTRTGNKDFWNKKEHRDMTMKRYTENPLRIKIIRESGSELCSTPVDWFISRYLIYQFGTHNKISPDVRRIHHELPVWQDFNEHYDPFYRPERYILNGRLQTQQEDTGKPRWLYFFIGFMSYPVITEFLNRTAYI